jgi:hypothetical protein
VASEDEEMQRFIPINKWTESSRPRRSTSSAAAGQAYLVLFGTGIRNTIGARFSINGNYVSPSYAGPTAAFQHAWPTLPLRVEAVAYADPRGAYTTADPPLDAMSGLNPQHTGVDGLEQLFHECSPYGQIIHAARP